MASALNQGIVDLYCQDLEGSAGFILTEFSGMTVDQVDSFRMTMRQKGAKYRVYKNKLAKVAFQKQGIEGLDGALQGTTAVVIAFEDIVAVAQELKKQAKETEHLKIKMGFVEGQVLDSEKVSELADIPSIEVLHTRLVMALNAPISGLVQVLSGIPRQLLYALNAIKDRKSD